MVPSLPSLSLSLSFPPSSRARSLPPPPLSRLALSLPPLLFSLDTRCRNAAPMTLPRLPLLLLARTYSRVRDTRGTATVRHRCRRLGGFDPSSTGAFCAPSSSKFNSPTSWYRLLLRLRERKEILGELFPGVGSRGEINLGDRQSIGERD